MNETFWGLYESQVAALRECSSEAERNTILLETAKFLIENIDTSAEVIAGYDKFGIRKLFASHNTLGNAIVAFYEDKKDILDPAAKVGTIGNRMEAIGIQIRDTDKALNELQEKEKDLFSKEDELRLLQKKLSDCKVKLSELQNIEETAASEIARYEAEFAKIDKIVQSYDEELCFWKAHFGENSDIIKNMSVYGISSLTELIDSIEKVKSNVYHDLKAFDVLIGKIIKAEETARDEVLKKQNKIV